MQKYAVRHAADEDAWATAVTDFYAAHAALVTQTLQVSPEAAQAYCASQAAQIVSRDAGAWVETLERWQTAQYAAGLAALALEES